MNMEPYIKTLKGLIAIKSVTGSKESHKAISYVENFFREEKAFVRKYNKNGLPAIVVSNKPGYEFDTIMCGHLDVVPAPDSMFIPRTSGGKMHGRGACDMKVSIAVMMHIMRDILRTERKEKIALMLTTDEEIGGDSGAGYLLDAIGYRAKVALIPDSGTSVDEIVIVNKGLIHLRLSAHGRPAHGSRPWEGVNAIDKLVLAVARVRKFVESIPYRPKSKFSDKVGGKWKNTCVLSKVSAGSAINQIPDRAEGYLDIRLTEGNDAHKILKKIQAIAKDCEVEAVSIANAVSILPSSDYLKKYMVAMESVLGTKPKLVRYYGANDGTHFSRYAIPVIASRPNCGGQHSNNEWVELKSIEYFYEIIRSFIENSRF